MTEKQEKKFLKKCIHFREFSVPVFHNELSEDETEIEIAESLFDVLEACTIPFVVVRKNVKNEQELDVYFYGFISRKEKEQIIREIVTSTDMQKFSKINIL